MHAWCSCIANFPYYFLQITSSWNKSIEICCIRNGSGEVVAKSEHPITLDENLANVPCIQEKLSQEAFGGAKIRLLNSKNILIADADGTRYAHTNIACVLVLV